MTRESRRPSDDLYSEELAQTQNELEVEGERLQSYVDELKNLGVELKSDEIGLCDFRSLMNGREVYLCWRLGEPAVMFWHELDAGFSGRQKLKIHAESKAADERRLTGSNHAACGDNRWARWGREKLGGPAARGQAGLAIP